MKRFAVFGAALACSAGLVVGQDFSYPTPTLGTVAQIGQVPPVPGGQLAPIPSAVLPPMDVVADSYPVPATGMAPAVPVYENVRYIGERRIAPCAVPMYVFVPNPCDGKKTCCKTCVAVKICVPPCKEACIKIRRDGHVVRYDFGHESVTITSLNGRLWVRYGG